MTRIFHRLNVVGECRAARIGLWSCPPFLFVVMGFLNVTAMLASYFLANRYVEEPQVAALIVLVAAVIIFVIGNFIIHGFTQIAEANRIKSEFLAIVSHQLRSPLSIFKWTLDALMRPASSAAEDNTPSYLATLSDNAEKMIQLVNMLLDVSRIEAGRLILRRDPVRLDVITEEIVGSLGAYARASNIALDYLAPVHLPAVRGDHDRLRMVIQNLVDNAIRYSYSGGRVAVTIAPVDSFLLEWKIQDSGVGISTDQHRFVFQKFFRSPEAVRHHTEGSGVGLYIARSIITALGGEIGFQSRDGKGSVFWFRLPVYQR